MPLSTCKELNFYKRKLCGVFSAREWADVAISCTLRYDGCFSLSVSLFLCSPKVSDFCWSSNFRRLPSLCRLRPPPLLPRLTLHTHTKKLSWQIHFRKLTPTHCPFYNVPTTCHVLCLDIRLTGHPLAPRGYLTRLRKGLNLLEFLTDVSAHHIGPIFDCQEVQRNKKKNYFLILENEPDRLYGNSGKELQLHAA